jgi:hypothetical protein
MNMPHIYFFKKKNIKVQIEDPLLATGFHHLLCPDLLAGVVPLVIGVQTATGIDL